MKNILLYNKDSIHNTFKLPTVKGIFKMYSKHAAFSVYGIESSTEN